MIKEKPCKGSGKARGSGCSTVTDVRQIKFGLCWGCFKEWLNTTENGKDHVTKVTIQSSKKVKLEAKRKLSKEKREFIESNKSIQRLILDARKPFQKWIRFRDANKSCISCDSIDSELWDAGHFYKAEIYSGLIFDERNVNKQCRKCNTYLGGNENNYRLGILKRFSEAFVLKLDKDALRLKQYKYDRLELINIKNKYLKLLKEINK